MLRKGDGTTNAAGTQPIFFRIWDAPTGGTLYWSESQPVAIDATGLFNVELGGGTPTQDGPAPKFSVADGISQVFQGDQLDQRWLELQVGDGSSAISPRQRFLAAPYAFGVANVDRAEGSFTVDQTLTVQGGADIAGAASLGSTLVVSSTATVGELKLPPPPSSGDPFAISPGTIDGDTAYMDIGDGPGWKLHMRGSGTNVITFENEGRIGIKQPNPQVELDVNGTIQATNLLISGTMKPFMIKRVSSSSSDTGHLDTGVPFSAYSAVVAGFSYASSTRIADSSLALAVNMVKGSQNWQVYYEFSTHSGNAGTFTADVLFINSSWVSDSR